MRLAGPAALAALMLATGAKAQTPCTGAAAGARLIVQVAGVKPARGQVVVTVYPDDPQRFLAPHGKLLRTRVQAVSPVTRACFELPGPGAYAVAVYHDANGDGRFNRSLIGLPAEGYGFSNDAPTTMGLPAFAAARFTASAGETTEPVTLRYPR